ncbi:MAG: 30S ribosomal protein S21 [Allomuricauda sp.]|jgi:small subunit ribosomal protein S21|uniref:Small ribosomal subunit protein bS21 n=1 Tax=Flagellimonas sp. MMG031 TaxID=3158549 RepID=A0AAU7N0C7_9FLAO|nr:MULTISPECIES: 30S ribosomal protein S21 [Allomuricauda]MBO6533164.1 30S ribosomal protein S21 [Allomuricauda sp.]MBO6588350.1 30S ribosomal protein S21 [Allomuricauda sp.]MBO6617975.1 30S ribosomal protein S21 [Allomuricauda sp.]MBO6643014.1 30S ribosomal protein S21 [Allomuricauda sp.]MBO6746310.1 30S ribosomal protein S21 [Allomuricauda sp.]
MLKIEVKPGESIERALKRYKRKYRNTKRLDQIRDRQEYTKKSVERRKTLKKAQYKEQFLNEQEDQ